MSGKKYKTCCDKTGLWKFFSEQNLNYFDENFAIAQLVNDENFMRFYLTERVKISKPVFVVQSDYLQSKASFGSIEKDAYVILVSKPQVAIDESIHLAHEVGHLVLCSEGYKLVSFLEESDNSRSRIHKMINDMIYDPIVNSRLLKYGQDLSSYLKLSDNIQIKSIGHSSNSYEDLFLVMTLCVKRFYDFRNIYPNISFDEIEFNIWAKKHYPDLVTKSEHIIDCIEKTGRSTPQEVEEALELILDYLDLKHKLKIESL